QAKEEGLSNHDIFDKMSKARVALPDDKEPPKRHNRTGSHDRIPQQGDCDNVLAEKIVFQNSRRKSLFGDVSNDNDDTKKLRRNQIFEDGFDFTLASARKGMAKLAKGFDKTKARGQTDSVFQDGNDKLILEALVNFFFMGDDSIDQMNALIDTMQKDTCPAGQWLMQEGEPGDTMYVIKTGKLEVFVGGKLTRHIGRGGAVGELALLYHTPRSASVKAVEDCVLFSLHRTKFREMLALSVSVSLVQRVAWMRAIPELEPLDKEAASRLAGAFNTIQLRQGETVAVEGSTVDRCFLVEFGTVEVTSSLVTAPELIRKQLKAAIPKPDTPRHSESTGGGEGESQRKLSSEVSPRARESEPLGGRLEETEEGADVDQFGEPRRRQSKGLVFGPGTFFGMPVLLCAGKGTKGGCWEAAPDQGTQAQADDGGAGATGEGPARPAAGGFAGAICPVTITANEDVRLSYFTPAQFETIVGPIREMFSQLVKGRPSILKKAESQRHTGNTVDCRFTTSDFKTEVFLGTGSFGRVTLVTFKDKEKQEAAELGDVEFFALKALAKKAVVERGQLAHVKDEKLLLQNMNHPLILGLFSTFQDANSIFFLMEAVTAGEMWSIVYEAASGFPDGELPIEHGSRFYAACVLEALSFMHSRGVAYRDLKPENIMVDGEGYPRLIDLGFAKEIPFTRVIEGKSEVHPKSFTMCGTPEYLAPEFIFNAGHDKSVDCWALGVLTFEFTAGYTPFQPPGEAADITALFTRIAGSKTAGSAIFPSNYDQKAKNEHSRDIVSKFLNADPTQRLGNLAGGLDEAKKHPYFESIDWNGLAHKRMPAPWKPARSLAPPAFDEGTHKDVPIFTGDDTAFANW
ncbi:unnamed protein product, partial [Laminaria digitata]